MRFDSYKCVKIGSPWGRLQQSQTPCWIWGKRGGKGRGNVGPQAIILATALHFTSNNKTGAHHHLLEAAISSWMKCHLQNLFMQLATISSLPVYCYNISSLLNCPHSLSILHAQIDFYFSFFHFHQFSVLTKSLSAVTKLRLFNARYTLLTVLAKVTNLSTL